MEASGVGGNFPWTGQARLAHPPRPWDHVAGLCPLSRPRGDRSSKTARPIQGEVLFTAFRCLCGRCTRSKSLPRVEYLVLTSVLQRGKLRLRQGGKFAWEHSASEWTVLNFLPCAPGLSLLFVRSLCIECLCFLPFCLASSCSSSRFSWTAPSLEDLLGPHPRQVVTASGHP